MPEEKTRRILFTALLLCGLFSIIVSFHNMDSSKFSAYGQVSDPSTDPSLSTNADASSNDPGMSNPGDNSTNLGDGPIPEDNSTNLGDGPIPEDTSVNPPDLQSSDNFTNSDLSNYTSPTGDNTTFQGPVQTNPTAIPEFGAVAPIILIIAVSSIIIFRMKLSS